MAENMERLGGRQTVEGGWQRARSALMIPTKIIIIPHPRRPNDYNIRNCLLTGLFIHVDVVISPET